MYYAFNPHEPVGIMRNYVPFYITLELTLQTRCYIKRSATLSFTYNLEAILNRLPYNLPHHITA